LDTWQASVDSLRVVGSGVSRSTAVVIDGKLLIAGNNGTWLHLPGKIADPQQQWQSIGGGPRVGGPLILQDQGHIYLAGWTWQRLSLSDRNTRPVMLQGHAQVEHWARSSHYGIVGWNPRSTFYQASIDDAGPPPRPAPAPQNAEALVWKEKTYRPDEQARLRAVEGIKSLLASSGTLPSRAKTAYTTGVAHHDHWIPVPGSQLWLDPPEKREGLRLSFVDDLLVQIESLTHQAVTKFVYDDADRLRLVASFYGGDIYDHYHWADYGEDGLIDCVLGFGSDFEYQHAVQYEHAADRSQTNVARYAHDGKCTGASLRGGIQTVYYSILGPNNNTARTSVFTWRHPAENLLRYGLKSHCPPDASQVPDARR
jgi:hypothetical protein